MEGAKATLYDTSEVTLNAIAVLPFRQASHEDVSGGVVRCPLCGLIFQVDKISGRPEEVVEDIFMDHLQRVRRVHLIPSEKIKTVYDSALSGANKTAYPDMICRIGRELNADAVVVGHLYRFRQRVGYPYSVKQPASVMFHIHFVRVIDGAVIWTGDLDKTQKSLMEDVLQLPFFCRGKGRWLTAEELAEEGIREILKNFPATGKNYFH
ncbi:MAG: hypothetical protein JXA41_05745 [Deltaproteobacteria bacterium]|nr:hypothetical protein [Deltaproteobacteria bacterium]